MVQSQFANIYVLFMFIGWFPPTSQKTPSFFPLKKFHKRIHPDLIVNTFQFFSYYYDLKILY